MSGKRYFYLFLELDKRWSKLLFYHLLPLLVLLTVFIHHLFNNVRNRNKFTTFIFIEIYFITGD